MMGLGRKRALPKIVRVRGGIPGDGFQRLDPDSPGARKRLKRAREMLLQCVVCPRMCAAARLAGESGTCRSGGDLRVASWNLHHGEEPPISGTGGSGTVFLSGCSLRCVYCQNYPISQMGVGDVVTVPDLVTIMLKLERSGAHNINFVTPTHYTPALIEAILEARHQGLSIPIVWNTSGYERVETLKLLEGLVDVYLADMRYGEAEPGKQYSKADDYPTVNRAAIQEMHRQVGTLQIDDEGVATRGLLVRHLVLPGGLSGSEQVFRFLAEEISPETHVSLMSQYFPAHQVGDHPLLGRRLTAEEYEQALAALTAAGLTQGFRQGP
ncbi:MAG TPA: radical SAM protein [Acidobacteriota bacterium]|nr:radical SAM protein [Acidobacteriota bacterium]